MEHNSDFRYDLKIGEQKENELASILSDETLELKFDRKALDTGNVYVEYQSRGKPSGIAKSEAKWYAFCLGNSYHILDINELRLVCRKYIGTKRDKVGGDSNSSKGILLPINELLM